MFGLGIPPWLIGAAGGLALLIAAFLFGRSTGIDHQKAVYAKAEAKAVAAMEKGRRAIDTVSGQLAEAQRDQSIETREIYHEATKIIERPVYRNICVDADGVRLLDRARANANRSFIGEPAGNTTGAASDAPTG
jgi:hypothetical protein